MSAIAQVARARALRLLVITALEVADEARTCDAIDAALSAVPRGASAIGLRDHGASAATRVRLGRRLRSIADRWGAALLVHDRVDVALTIRADGVHLGARSISIAEARALLSPDALIGCSCHDEAELARAAAGGADYATLSPLFFSAGKGEPLGEARFSLLRGTQPAMHVLALGGIDAAGAMAARRAGADGVAVIRGVLAAQDPRREARALVSPFEQ